ncbi:MAG: hypothetical protein LBJ88_01235 [Campylobacteraceae bacterium]|jgi:hypothetical protein|nr:hypothetical protein [Campylobacteraceae bacterium]
MKLYETDKDILHKFICTEHTDQITDEYLILYNFASDLKYSNYIQKDLFLYLLNYYLKIIDKAQNNKNKSVILIYEEFNTALFKNRKNIISSIGKKEYISLMNFYNNCFCTHILSYSFGNMRWIPFFNTIIAFDSNNIGTIMNYILNFSSDNSKANFFLYLSVLLFEKSDNIYSDMIDELYVSGELWEYDSSNSSTFYWNEETIVEFKNIFSFTMMNDLLDSLNIFFEKQIGKDLTLLIYQKILTTCDSIYLMRRDEYLKKMGSAITYKYWDDAYS